MVLAVPRAANQLGSLKLTATCERRTPGVRARPFNRSSWQTYWRLGFRGWVRGALGLGWLQDCLCWNCMGVWGAGCVGLRLL